MPMHRLASVLVPVLALTLFPACGDDGDDMMGGGSPTAAVEGSWAATSFSVDGTDYVAQGMTFMITFSDGTYSINVTNDTAGVFCEGTTDCVDGGSVSATTTTITFEPGTQDEVTLNYARTATTMTLDGTIDGMSLVASLVAS